MSLSIQGSLPSTPLRDTSPPLEKLLSTKYSDSSQKEVKPRLRRTIESLREACLRKLDPQNLPNTNVRVPSGEGGGSFTFTADECLIEALSSPADLSHLPPAWFGRLTQSQMEVLPAPTLNGLSQEQWREISSEQISWIKKDVFENLSAATLNGFSQEQWRGISPEQISWIKEDTFKNLNQNTIFLIIKYYYKYITGDQLRSISLIIFQNICKQLIETIPHIDEILPSKVEFLCEFIFANINELTNQQINNFLQTIIDTKENYKKITNNVIKNLRNAQNSTYLSFIISYVLRNLNQPQIASLSENVLRSLDPEIAQGAGGYLSRWLSPEQRAHLSQEVNAILEANSNQLKLVESWDPQQQLSESEWRTRLQSISLRTYTFLPSQLHAVIPGSVLAEFLGRFDNSFDERGDSRNFFTLNELQRWDISNFWTRDQFSAIINSLGSPSDLYRMFLIRLSPTLIAQLTSDQFQIVQNSASVWDADQIQALNLQVIRGLTFRQFANIAISCNNDNSYTWIFTREQLENISIDYIENLNKIIGNERLTPELIYPIVRFLPSLTEEFYLRLSPRALAVVPPEIFALRTERFIRGLDDSGVEVWNSRVGALTPTQVSHLQPRAFGAFTIQQLPRLRRTVFSEVTSAQLGELIEPQIQSITNLQLQAIPVATLRDMGKEKAATFYRSLTESQRNALTPEQRAFFEDLMAGLTTQEAGKRNEDSTPPPGGSSGGNGQGGSSGGPGTGGGGASGGARPKDPNAFRTFIKFANSKTPGNKRSAVPMLPLETIRQKNAAFWEPKYTTFSTPLSSSGDNSTYGFNAAFGFERRVIEADLKKYQECVRELTDDQLRAIPDALIPLIDPLFFGCLSPRQLMRMRLEQRAAITAKFIKVEGDLKRILNITDDRIVTPAEYQAILDKADRKRIRDRLTPETIQTLADDPRSFLLYHLKPEHFFDNGANDWNRDQIAALPKELIVSVWTADYFNRLTPHQWLGIRARYFREIAPEVIAGWKQNCFEPPFVLESNNEYQQGYQDRICTLEKRQIQAISPKVISTLSPKFFEKNFDTLRIKMLTKKQVEAISEKTINNLSPRVFYNLIRFVDGVNLMTPNQIADGRRLWIALTPKQIAAMPLTFFSTFGEYNNSQLSVLDSFNLSQIRAIRTEQLDAMKLDFGKLTARVYNKLSTEQIQTRSLDQIRAINFPLYHSLNKDFDLSKDFINKLMPIQIAGLKPEQIVALKGKIVNIPPDVFRDGKATANIFSNASGDQLHLFSKDQIGRVDLTKISSPVFGKACEKGGMAFFKKFSLGQIDRLSLAQRTAIPIKIYGTLIIEIYNKMADAEIEQYAINLPAAAFRTALIAWKEGLEEGEATFRDRHRQEILKGTFRVKMERTAPATPPTMTFLSGQRGWGSDQGFGLETQIRTPQVETQMPSRGVELRA